MDETTVNVTAAGGDYAYFSDELDNDSIYSSPSSIASSPAVMPHIVVVSSSTPKYEVTVTANRTPAAAPAPVTAPAPAAASNSTAVVQPVVPAQPAVPEPSSAAVVPIPIDLSNSPSPKSASPKVIAITISPLQSSAIGVPAISSSDAESASISIPGLANKSTAAESSQSILTTSDPAAAVNSSIVVPGDSAVSNSPTKTEVSSTSSSPTKAEILNGLPSKIDPQPPSAAATANIPASITTSPEYQKEYSEYYTKYYTTYYNHYANAGYSTTAATSKDSVGAPAAGKQDNTSATVAAAQAYAHHYASYYAAQHAAASAAHKQQTANSSAPSSAAPASAPPASTHAANGDASASNYSYNSTGQYSYSGAPNGPNYPGYSYGQQYQYNSTSSANPAASTTASASSASQNTAGNAAAHLNGHSATNAPSQYCSCASCLAQFGAKNNSHNSSAHSNSAVSDPNYSASYANKSGAPCNCANCQTAASQAAAQPSAEKNLNKHTAAPGGSYAACPCAACAQSRVSTAPPSSYQYSPACACAACLTARAPTSKNGKEKDAANQGGSLALLKSMNAPQTPASHHNPINANQTPSTGNKKGGKSAKKTATPASAVKSTSAAISPVLEPPKSAKKEKSLKEKEKEKEKERKEKEKEKTRKEKEKEKERLSSGGLNIGQLDMHATDDLIHLPGDDNVDMLMPSNSAILASALASIVGNSRTGSPTLSPALSSSPHPFDSSVFAPIPAPSFSPTLPSLHSPTASPPLSSLLSSSAFPAPFPRSPRMSFIRHGDAAISSSGMHSSLPSGSVPSASGFSFFSPSPTNRSPKFGLFSTLLNSPSPSFSLPSPSLPPIIMLQKNPLELRKSPHLNNSNQNKLNGDSSKSEDDKLLDGSMALPKTPNQSYMRSPISIAINSRTQSPEIKSANGKSLIDEKNSTLSILDKLQSLQNPQLADNKAVELSKKRRRDGSGELLLGDHLGTPKLKSTAVSALMLSHSPTFLPLSNSPFVPALSGLHLPLQKSSNLSMCHQCKHRKPILTMVYCCNHSKNRKKYKAELQNYQAAQLKSQDQATELSAGKKSTELPVVIPIFTPIPIINLAGRSCPHRFCESCLLKSHGEKAPQKRPPISSWSCPKCRGSCVCRKCRREREKERNYADPSTMPPAVALASALVYAVEELNEEMRAFREEAERELAANPGLRESIVEDEELLVGLESEPESLSPSASESEDENSRPISVPESKRKKSSSVNSTPKLSSAAAKRNQRKSLVDTPLILSHAATGSPKINKLVNSSSLGDLELPPSAFNGNSDFQSFQTDSLLAIAQQAKLESQSPKIKISKAKLKLKGETVSPQMRAIMEAASSAQPIAPFDLKATETEAEMEQ